MKKQSLNARTRGPFPVSTAFLAVQGAGDQPPSGMVKASLARLYDIPRLCYLLLIIALLFAGCHHRKTVRDQVAEKVSFDSAPSTDKAKPSVDIVGGERSLDGPDSQGTLVSIPDPLPDRSTKKDGPVKSTREVIAGGDVSLGTADGSHHAHRAARHLSVKETAAPNPSAEKAATPNPSIKKAVAPNPSIEKAQASPPSEQDHLHQGSVQWKEPELTVGKWQTLEVLISWATQDLTAQLSVKGKPHVEDIEVAGVMRAMLSVADKSTCEVVPVDGTDSLHRLTSFSPTTWQWDIRPLKSGPLRLNLAVDAFLLDDRNAPIAVRVFERDMTVKANPTWQAAQFVKTTWQFLASAIVIPLVVFGWNKMRKLKAQPESQQPDEHHRHSARGLSRRNRTKVRAGHESRAMDGDPRG